MADLLGLAPALERQLGLHRFDPFLVELALGQQVVEHARVDHADQHGVGADAVPPLLARDALHQRFVGGLWRHGQAVAVRPVDMPGGAEMDEGAALFLPEMRDERLGGGEEAVHLDIDGALPFLHGRLRQIELVDQRAGGPDQRVDAAMLGDGGVARGLDGSRVRHVQGMQRDLPAEAAEFLCQLLGGVLLVAVAERDIAAGAR